MALRCPKCKKTYEKMGHYGKCTAIGCNNYLERKCPFPLTCNESGWHNATKYAKKKKACEKRSSKTIEEVLEERIADLETTQRELVNALKSKPSTPPSHPDDFIPLANYEEEEQPVEQPIQPTQRVTFFQMGEAVESIFFHLASRLENESERKVRKEINDLFGIWDWQTKIESLGWTQYLHGSWQTQTDSYAFLRCLNNAKKHVFEGSKEVWRFRPALRSVLEAWPELPSKFCEWAKREKESRYELCISILSRWCEENNL